MGRRRQRPRARDARRCQCRRSRSYVPQNADDARCAGTTQVLCETKRVPFELHVAGFAANLRDYVTELRDARGTHGMSLGFQAAAGIDGLLAITGSSAGGFERAAAA